MSRVGIAAIVVLLLAAGVASATTIFKATVQSDNEDFCFGYAICE